MEQSASRRAAAAELFHLPGGATQRAIEELYALMDLELPVEGRAAQAAGFSFAAGAST